MKSGALYFATVFCAGFALGAVRVLWAVPRFGERSAELMEAPIMLVAIVFAACWVVRRLDLPPRPLLRFGTGIVAAALLLVAEFALVLRLRGLSIGDYFAARDPVAEAVYYVMLAVMVIMPVLVERRKGFLIHFGPAARTGGPELRKKRKRRKFL